MDGMLDKLSGDNAYALMGLLGANIMPHNFYLHSSIVQVFSFPFHFHTPMCTRPKHTDTHQPLFYCTRDMYILGIML